MSTTTDTGRTLADGRYRLERLLGRGAMGAVWLGHDERLGRSVAVKEMAGPLAADQRYVVRFRREAQVAGALSHPNLLRVFDCALDQARPFLVMEHVGGGTLAERLGDGRGAGDCRGLARQLLEALVHVHGAGLVHRNLHPGNILVGDDGRPRVTGFASVLPADVAGRGGEPIGPERYTAPELLAGQGASPASDLYALGVVLAECTGGDGPVALERLIEHLTAQDPNDRPISAAVALEELDAQSPATPAAVRRGGAAGDPAAADRTARFTRGTTPVSGRPAARRATTTGSAPVAHHPRRPRRIALAALAVTGLVATGSVIAATSGGEPDPQPAPARAPAAERPARGDQVDRSLDRLEGIVRGAQEAR